MRSIVDRRTPAGKSAGTRTRSSRWRCCRPATHRLGVRIVRHGVKPECVSPQLLDCFLLRAGAHLVRGLHECVSPSLVPLTRKNCEVPERIPQGHRSNNAVYNAGAVHRSATGGLATVCCEGGKLDRDVFRPRGRERPRQIPTVAGSPLGRWLIRQLQKP